MQAGSERLPYHRFCTPLKSHDYMLADDISAYLKNYDTFSDEWWRMALLRRESRDNFQRYIGKRKAMDSFWAGIKRNMKLDHPDLRVRVAYGSAITKLKALKETPKVSYRDQLA